MDEISTCPLGSECYTIKDNKPYRCAWHVKLRGTDAQGQEVDEWACAIAWQPILQLEMANTNRGQTQAIESLREESIKRMDVQLQHQNLALKTINAKVIEG